jgi:hypothetical protein
MWYVEKPAKSNRKAIIIIWIYIGVAFLDKKPPLVSGATPKEPPPLVSGKGVWSVIKEHGPPGKDFSCGVCETLFHAF